MGDTWNPRFENRSVAGRELAARLALEITRDLPIVVLGLPRGGVPVAVEVAHLLDAPLDVVLVRKLGVPGRRELAMGAIGEGGVEVLDRRLMNEMRVDEGQLAAVHAEELETLEERGNRLRRGGPQRQVDGSHVILVDDGVATGSTAAVACEVVRRLGAKHITLAAPVLPHSLTTSEGAARVFGNDVDVVFVHAPRDFWAVGRFYEDFTQVTDGEVEEMLSRFADG